MVVNACLFVFRLMQSNEFHLHGRSRYKRSNRVRNALARRLSKETQQSQTKFALARRLSFQTQTKRIQTHIYYKRQRFVNNIWKCFCAVQECKCKICIPECHRILWTTIAYVWDMQECLKIETYETPYMTFRNATVCLGRRFQFHIALLALDRAG